MEDDGIMSRNYLQHPEMFDSYFAAESFSVRQQHEEIVGNSRRAKMLEQNAETIPASEVVGYLRESLAQLGVAAKELDQLLPDSLNRPMATRIQILLDRADRESKLAVKLRQALEDIANPDQGALNTSSYVLRQIAQQALNDNP